MNEHNSKTIQELVTFLTRVFLINELHAFARNWPGLEEKLPSPGSPLDVADTLVDWIRRMNEFDALFERLRELRPNWRTTIDELAGPLTHWSEHIPNELRKLPLGTFQMYPLSSRPRLLHISDRQFDAVMPAFDALDQRLQLPQAGSRTSTGQHNTRHTVAVIVGQTIGVGCSHLACHYGDERRERVAWIIWIEVGVFDPDAITEARARVEQEILRRASALLPRGASGEDKPPSTRLDLIWSRLSSLGAGLIILNDVVTPEVLEILPPENVHVLVTTTLENDWPEEAKLYLTDMSREVEQAEAMILDGWARGKDPSNEERAAARELALRVDYLPLGLRLVAQILRASRWRPSALLQRVQTASNPMTAIPWEALQLRRPGEELSSRRMGDLLRLVEVAHASLDAIMEPSVSYAARRLFRIAAHLAPGVQIPRELLFAMAQGQSSSRRLDENSLSRGLDALTRRGLISAESDHVKTHPYIAKLTRFRGEAEDLDLPASAIDAFERWIGARSVREGWSRYLLPEMEHLEELIRQVGDDPGRRLRCALLLQRCVVDLESTGENELALERATRYVHNLASLSGVELARARLLCTLAHLEARQTSQRSAAANSQPDRLEEAERLLATLRDAPPRVHPMAELDELQADILHEKGKARRLRGRREKSRALLEESRELLERAVRLLQDHPQYRRERAWMMSSLAQTLRELAKWSSREDGTAIAFLRSAAERLEEADRVQESLGSGPRDRVGALQELAKIHVDLAILDANGRGEHLRRADERSRQAIELAKTERGVETGIPEMAHALTTRAVVLRASAEDLDRALVDATSGSEELKRTLGRGGDRSVDYALALYHVGRVLQKRAQDDDLQLSIQKFEEARAIALACKSAWSELMDFDRLVSEIELALRNHDDVRGKQAELKNLKNTLQSRYGPGDPVLVERLEQFHNLEKKISSPAS